VKNGTYVQPERSKRLPDRLSAADRAGRSVERREEAVPYRIHLGPAVSADQRPDDRVVPFEQLAPTAVSELRRLLG